MKKSAVLVSILFSVLFFGFFLTKNASAATFSFDATSYRPNVGGSFDVGVNLDAGSDQVTSTDIYVTFDANLLTAQSVASGTYFPSVANNISSGVVYIAGLVNDVATYKTGSGKVATITFKANAAGSGTIGFDCTQSKIIKNDVNATNVLQCSQSAPATLTVGGGGGGGGGGGTAAPTPTALPRTGSFDNLNVLGISGGLLMLIGAMVKLVFQ